MVDVAVPTAAPLSSVRRVELAHSGQWDIGSGRWNASRDDLVAAVAALDCPAVRRPVLKLGHSQGEQPLWAGNPTGVPAVGYVDNLSLTNSGHTLVGDFVGMPGWLGDVAASAYPDRSVEGTYDFRCQIGHTHPFVLTAVALLGVTRPGVGTLRSLQDVGRLYGVEAASDPGTRVEARFDPRQPRWPDGAPGGLGGQWRDLTPDLDPANDKLKLAGRIRLGSSEKLVGSDRIGSGRDANYQNAAVLARIATADGPQLRLGIVDAGHERDDTRRWAGANRGGTVKLDKGGIGRLREGLAESLTRGREYQKDYRAAVAADLSDEEWARRPDPSDVIHTTVVPGDWGDLLVRVQGVDDEDGGWGIRLAVRPAGAGPGWEPPEHLELDLSPAKARQLAKELEAMLATSSVSAAASEHVEGLTLGDSEADLDLWADGTVTLGWDDYQAELNEAGAEGLVGAINQVRGGEAITAEAGPIRVARATGGDVRLDVQDGPGPVLLSDDDAYDLQAQIVQWFPAEGPAEGPVEARVFDPAKHPRWPKGTPGGLGGRFMPRDLVPRISGGESRSRRRSTPPARARTPHRRVRTGVTQADQARTAKVLNDLDEAIRSTPATRQRRGQVPALADTVRGIRDGVDRGEVTPDQAQVALAQLAFRPDVAGNDRVADRLHRAVNDLREAPTPEAPPTPERGAPQTPPTPASEPPPSSVPAAQDRLDQRVTETLEDLLARRRLADRNEYIPLADVRDALGDLSRQEQDETLRRLSRPGPDGRRLLTLVPETNQKVLSQRDRDARITLGNQPKDFIVLDEDVARQRRSTPSPTPSLSPGRPAEPAAVSISRVPEVDVPGDLMAQIRSASPAELRSLLAGLTVQQLQQVADSLGVRPSNQFSRSALTDDILGALANVRASADEAGWPITDDDGRIIMAQADRNQLKHYWTRDPRGLARWAGKPHPWTALFRQIRKHVGTARAKRIASQWFKEVFGIWPGERKGKNPAGPG